LSNEQEAQSDFAATTILGAAGRSLLLSVSPTDFRPITEVGNNVANPALVTANTDLIRLSPVAYAEGTRATGDDQTLSGE
jgi:hypothetical protein